jgi:hypothetical protein
VYLSRRRPLARLRAYRHELGQRYVVAVRRRDLPQARQLFDLRRRVHRAILLCEEFLTEDVGLAA